jgi:peptide/nickel transport system permease protein
MRWYVAKRLAWAVVATWLVLTITFGLMVPAQYAGADAAAAQAAAAGNDPETARQAYLEDRGLDRPIHVQYGDFVVGLLTLEWGYSQTYGQPVVEVVSDAWPYSAQYVVPSTILAALAGYSIGLYSAMHQHEPADYLGSFLAFFGVSIPNFWFAIVLILVFGVWANDATVFGIDLSVLSVNTYYESGGGFFTLENARQLILPTIVVSTASVAGQMRYSRAQALEYVHAQFVKTARAKGASERRILTHHVLRVALVPLSTILVADVLGIVFAGSFIVEAIFQIPGLGLKALRGIQNNDTDLVLVTTLIPVFVAIVGNLAQDIAYVLLDPRIDYEDRT